MANPGKVIDPFPPTSRASLQGPLAPACSLFHGLDP